MEKNLIAQRIQAYLDATGTSANEFAASIGFNQSNLSKILRGTRSVPSSLTEAITDKTNISRKWLLYGEGEMLNSDVTLMRRSELEEYTTTKNGTKFYTREDGKLVMKVPVVPVAALGSPDDEFAEIIREHEGDTVSIVVDAVHHGSYIAFRVDGDSMDDGTRDSFERGDIVVVRELSRDKWLPKLHFNKWPHWVIVFGNNVRLKDIIAQDETSITCHSLNPSPEYTDFTLHFDDINRLFNVIKKVPKEVDFGV